MSSESRARAAEVSRDPRWSALVARDAAADGTFFYSVKTTGVFCRPSCASRRARPENVAFHASVAEARRAGFRACKRCEPERAPLAERQAARVAELCRFLERAESVPSLEALAERAGMSAFHLHRVFKAVTGLTPRAYAAAHRAERVRRALSESASKNPLRQPRKSAERGLASSVTGDFSTFLEVGSVTEAFYAAGFGSSGRFYETSNEVLGMTPGRYRSGGAEMEIRFAIGECSLGAILVAATERGVCAILLGDDPQALAHDLERRFPRAQLIGADAAFESHVAQVVGLIEQPRLGVTLPLDVRGTAFQQRVWKALQSIPVGTTATYAALAQRLGSPKAVRAVAGACAANPLAVAIPCHRVVRTDGGLSGYRWGVERKRALLEREARP